MRVALAQFNSYLGNFEFNYKKIIEFSNKAKERHCDIVLFPESCLFGYHPMDLLKRKSVVNEQLKYLKKIVRKAPRDILIVFGAFTLNPEKKGKPFFNSAVLLLNGKIIGEYHKELLPTYDVFDDARHIEPGEVHKNIFKYKGKKILITICEDIWAWPVDPKNPISAYRENPIKKIKPGSVDLILNLSASPYFTDKMNMRYSVTAQTAKHLRAPLIYVNMVGGQDELIFDGASFAMDKRGKIFAQNLQFEEDLNIVDVNDLNGASHFKISQRDESLRRALILGLRDFVKKCGLQRVHLGLSGGIDSAVVACLAVDALGAHNVKSFALPGPFSSSKSLHLAKKLAHNLNIDLQQLPISASYQQLVLILNQSIGLSGFTVTHENLQARLRGILLMAVANKENSLLLNTSNKSEMATGYGTLYGDMAGGLSPIGDLLKEDIYRIARLYNREQNIIPPQIIKRAPSAELRPNQKDSDSLPSYNLLDRSVVQVVEKSAPAKSKTDKFLLQKLMTSEFKRWQSPPILKVRESSFGQGRRMPIAHRGFY